MPQTQQHLMRSLGRTSWLSLPMSPRHVTSVAVPSAVSSSVSSSAAPSRIHRLRSSVELHPHTATPSGDPLLRLRPFPGFVGCLRFRPLGSGSASSSMMPALVRSCTTPRSYQPPAHGGSASK